MNKIYFLSNILYISLSTILTTYKFFLQEVRVHECHFIMTVLTCVKAYTICVQDNLNKDFNCKVRCLRFKTSF